MPIIGWEELKTALKIRMDEFAGAGCVASDHGMEAFPFLPVGEEQVKEIVKKALDGQPLTAAEAEGFQTELLLWLGREYAKRGWAMELHMNAMRFCNTRAVETLAEATGFDSVCDHPLALKLAAFMDELDKTRQLPKTILFSLNDVDNMVISTMTCLLYTSMGLTRCMAGDVSADGIRVNAIIPGFIDTPMFHQAVDGDIPRQQKILGHTPMNRYGSPEDIGWAAVYLSSDAAAFVNGTSITVDGGCSIGF